MAIRSRKKAGTNFQNFFIDRFRWNSKLYHFGRCLTLLPVERHFSSKKCRVAPHILTRIQTPNLVPLCRARRELQNEYPNVVFSTIYNGVISVAKLDFHSEADVLKIEHITWKPSSRWSLWCAWKNFPQTPNGSSSGRHFEATRARLWVDQFCSFFVFNLIWSVPVWGFARIRFGHFFAISIRIRWVFRNMG